MPGHLHLKAKLLVTGLLLGVLLGLTVRAVPHTPFYEQNLPWIIARGVGLAALVLLALVVAVGLLTSHPLNRGVWRWTRDLTIWHRYLVLFVMALIVVHVAALLLDRYANISLVGALVPGRAGYRTAAVALGTIALYSLILTGLTAAYAARLPRKLWLYIHRCATAIFALSWAHGLLAGSDSVALQPLYLGLATFVLLVAVTRYWLDMPRSKPLRKGERRS